MPPLRVRSWSVNSAPGATRNKRIGDAAASRATLTPGAVEASRRIRPVQTRAESPNPESPTEERKMVWPASAGAKLTRVTPDGLTLAEARICRKEPGPSLRILLTMKLDGTTLVAMTVIEIKAGAESSPPSLTLKVNASAPTKLVCGV